MFSLNNHWFWTCIPPVRVSECEFDGRPVPNSIARRALDLGFAPRLLMPGTTALHNCLSDCRHSDLYLWTSWVSRFVRVLFSRGARTIPGKKPLLGLLSIA